MKIKKLIIITLILLAISSTVSATNVVSTNVTPSKIFKCQPTTLVVEFDDDAITTLTATFQGQGIIERGIYIFPIDSIGMNKIYANVWQGTYGNDATLTWGLKTIIYTDNADVTYPGGTVFVYSDMCVGTDITNYTGISSGLGRYTSMIYGGKFTFFGTSIETSFIGWAIYPFLEYWGYLFYLIVVFMVCSTIYLKTQNVTQPLVIAVILLLVLASSAVIEPVYRKWIVVILALGIGVLYYRVFVRD
jgi:hypothetical protein